MLETLVIEKKNVLITAQDGGRQYGSDFGVSRGGALSLFDVACANTAIQNTTFAPVLEVIQGGKFRFCRDTLFAVGGSACTADLAGDKVRPFCPTIARSGEVLEISPTSSCCYIALAGGVACRYSFGSCSPHLQAHLGTPPYEEGDIVCTQNAAPHQANYLSVLLEAERRAARWAIAPFMPQSRQKNIRLRYTAPIASDVPALSGATWRVRRYSRQGAILGAVEGFPQHSIASLPSAGVLPGTIQYLPSGDIALLLADAQTTGGYPVLGNVIYTDLSLFSSLCVGATINFQNIEIETAKKLVFLSNKLLARVQKTVRYLISKGEI